MKTTRALMNPVGCELAALALRKYLQDLLARWRHVDSLVAEKARLEAGIARDLFNAGRISKDERLSRWQAIDSWLDAFDIDPRRAHRNEITAMIREYIDWFFRKARELREEVSDAT
jgi:hypothetical protein